MNPLFNDAVKLVEKHIPGFEVRYKSEHWSSKIIACLVWIFNRDYMMTYTTTRYPHVYFPNREFVAAYPNRAVKILAHEFVHLWDRKNYGVWFSISYLLPQLIALVFIILGISVAFFKPWWCALLCALPAFILASPLPAVYRMKAELRGYSMSMAINFWRYNTISQSTIDWIANEFTGWSYYRMWPYKEDIDKRLEALAEDIKNEQFDGPFLEFKRFVDEHVFYLK